MTAKPSILVALAGAGLLATLGALAAGARAAEPAPQVEPDAADLLPGVALDSLTTEQRKVVARIARDEFCYCGCPHTLSGCLREHQACKHAPRMAALAARLAGAGLGVAEISKVLGDYYASFDRSKRVALDVAGFGPALGEPGAKVMIVEFSDFTCPYCQMLRPKLEAFVRAHKGRVNLVYKPFPLPSHARSFEAAAAAEWAREKGLFWPMHDALFEHPHDLDDDSLAALAEHLGGDPADLRKALETGRYKARIAASQDEARRGGLHGTPTLFFDGRRYTLPDHSDESLEFTLQDEEEWLAGGWGRD
jgi:protein-disulfide isomerase